METLGGSFMQVARNYLLQKHQQGWWEERFGPTVSFRELMEKLQAEDPSSLDGIVTSIRLGLAASAESSGSSWHDGLQRYVDRAALKQEQMVRDGIVWGSPLQNMVPPWASFEQFRPGGNASLEEGLKRTQEWSEGRGGPLLILAGPPGVGKTHLAAAAAQACLQAGEAILFRNEAVMVGEIHRAMQTGGAERIIEAVSSVPWLVIDDLGIQAMGTGGWDDTVRDRIIDARWQGAGTWKGALRTLVTMNFLGRDLPARVASRLWDDRWGGNYVGMDAPDYRRTRGIKGSVAQR